MKSWRDNPNISAYLDGQAADDVRREVEAAAAADPALQDFLRCWPKVQTAFAELPQYRLPSDFAEGVLAAIAAERPGGSRQSVTAASVVVAQAEQSSANGSASVSANGRQASDMRAARPARSWHASAWLAIAAAASLMALILLPPGVLAPDMLAPGDSRTNNVAQASDEEADKNAEGTELAGRTLAERAREDFAGSKMMQLADVAESELKNTEDDLKNENDLRNEDERKAKAEGQLGQPLAEAESPEQQQLRGFAQAADQSDAVAGQPSAEPVEAQSGEQDEDILLGMMFRLQEKLVGLETLNAKAGYLAASPPPTGVDVLVCDVFVPATISDADLTAAFEQTLALERETAIARYKNQVAARLQDSFADADQDSGQDNELRDQGLKFSIDNSRKNADIATLGKGGGEANAATTRGGFDRATPATIAGISMQTQEAYYVESTREQIDAALENLASKASSEIYADNLQPTNSAYQPWVMFSDAYRRDNVAAYGVPATGVTDAIEEFRRGPIGSAAQGNSAQVDSAQGGAASFGGGGGGGLGDVQTTADGGETRIAAGGAASGNSERAGTAGADDVSSNRDKDNSLAQDDTLPEKRGVAIRIPSHLYGGLPSDLALEFGQGSMGNDLARPEANTADTETIDNRAEKLAGTGDDTPPLRPRDGAIANQRDDDLQRGTGGRRRGRVSGQQQDPETNEQLRDGQRGPSVDAIETETLTATVPVRRAIVVLRIHRQVAPPTEANAQEIAPPATDDKQTDGGR